jgi:virginiamycin B lyase
VKVRGIVIVGTAMVALATLGVALGRGRGDVTPSLQLGSGSAWFATVHQGSAALLDGGTGSRVAHVDGVAQADADFTVVQSGSSALVVDRDRGTVARIDAATWTLGTPVPIGDPGDRRLDVHAGGSTAWVVSHQGGVVQQLDPSSMTMVGAPQTLPGPVTAAAVTDDGRLWAITDAGELRSYRDGRAATSARVLDTDHATLTLVGQRPVVVDLTHGRAAVVDPATGAPAGPACLDVPTDIPPAIGGSSDATPWFLATTPEAGTLVVSDIDAGTCTVVPLGPASAAARYGAPVEADRLVFVPDLETGQVVVVDPMAPVAARVKAHVDLGLAGAHVALSVRAGHVWFDEVDGDRAGVITEDLRAVSSSKAEAGAAAGSSPHPISADTGAPTALGTSTPATTLVPVPPDRRDGPGTDGGSSPAELPVPALDGGGLSGGSGGSGAGAGSSGGSGRGLVDFDASVSPAVVGAPVTFTDISPGAHAVTSWSAPDASRRAATSSTFTTSFPSPGTFSVTLTIDSPSGAHTITHTIAVRTQPTVPDLAGLTVEAAGHALAAAGLQLGARTATVDSPLADGLVVDSDPPAGTEVAAGTVVDYRDSHRQTYTEVAVPSANVGLYGIVTGRDGELWFTEQSADRIGRVTPGGGVGELVVPTPAGEPEGITLGGDGNVWFTEATGNKVAKVTPTGVITEYALPTPNASPFGVALGPDGNVWFAEVTGGKVGRVTPDGQVNELPLPGGGGGGARPEYLAAGADGNLWVTDAAAGTLDRVTPAGTVTTIPLPAGQVPYQIVAGPDGNLWVTDGGANHIDRVTTAGAVTVFATASTPYGITGGPDGELWFLEGDGVAGPHSSVSAITTDGTVTRHPLPNEDRDPLAITTGPDGNLWFTESQANVVARFSPS